MASLFRANVPYTRLFHGAWGAKTGLCERRTVTASQRGAVPATLNTLRHQPRSHRLFLGVKRGHALPGQPDSGTSANPDPTSSRGPAWNATSSLPRFGAGTRVSFPRRWRHRGLCPVPLGLLDFKKEEHDRLHPYLISPALKALAHSDLHMTQPIGGHLRANT